MDRLLSRQPAQTPSRVIVLQFSFCLSLRRRSGIKRKQKKKQVHESCSQKRNVQFVARRGSGWLEGSVGLLFRGAARGYWQGGRRATMIGLGAELRGRRDTIMTAVTFSLPPKFDNVSRFSPLSRRDPCLFMLSSETCSIFIIAQLI